MAEMIRVRAVRNEGVRVFQEDHPDHPNGAVDIWSNEGTHTVARTEGIDQAIERGDLLWIDEAEEHLTQGLPLVVEAPDPNADVSVASIPGYDDLTVEDIKTMAKQLTPEERDAIRRYEAKNKNRATLLAALDKQDGDKDGV